MDIRKLSPLPQKKLFKLKPINPQINSKSTVNRSMNISSTKKGKLKPLLLIPSNYSERIEFIKRLFNKEELLQVCTNTPLRVDSKPEDVGVYIASKLTSVPDICAALLLYMTLNFAVDTEHLNSKKIPDQSPESIYKSGSGLSEGLSKLFQSMALGAKIKVETVSGQLKPFDFKIGDPRTKHYWCVFKLENIHYLIDPTLAIGLVNSSNEFISILRPFYFLTPPEYLIDTHRPDSDKYQLIEKPLTIRGFSDKPLSGIGLFFCNLYQYNITLFVTPYSNQLYVNDTQYSIRLTVPEYTITAEYYKDPNQTDIKEIPIEYDDKYQANNIMLKCLTNGDYYLIIKGKKTLSSSSNEETYNILSFNITVKIITKRKLVGEPSFLIKQKRLNKCASDMDIHLLKNKCYDNKGAFLFEPKYRNLRIGHETKFKVKVRDAKLVAVLDGKKWNFLKRKEDDIYEGTVIIQHENVVICSLKHTNVYTEVFEFYASGQNL